MIDPKANEGRTPEVFEIGDPRLKVEAPLPEEPPLKVPAAAVPPPRSRWGTVFLSAVGGLAVLGIVLWVQDTILALLNRSGWLGWAATALFAAAALALFMIIAREVRGLLRLSVITATRKEAELALLAEDAAKARSVAATLRQAFKDKAELAPVLRKLQRHDHDVLTARQVIALHERKLLFSLDAAARAIVGGTGRRVAAVTSISPAPVAVAFVAYENLKMLRALSAVYGGRPGLLSVLKLVRLIGAHLAVTGGLALTDDLLNQIIGHGLTARLSKRLGEGLINGAFTIRIGLAALDVVRPLPYEEATPPRIREFVAEFLRIRPRSEAPKDQGAP